MIKLETAPDGNPLVGITDRDTTTYLSSKYSPGREAERIVDDLIVDDLIVDDPLGNVSTNGEGAVDNSGEELFVVFGLGNFFLPTLLFERLERFERVKYRVLVVDNYKLMKNWKQWLEGRWDEISYQERMGRCEFLEDLSHVKDTLSKMDDDKLLSNYVRYVSNPKQFTRHADFFEGIRTEVGSYFLNRGSNQATADKFRYLWERNLLMNTDVIIESFPYSRLEEKFNFQSKSFSAIIAAAGPTLSESLDLIKKADNTLIIACDTILKILLKNDIIPDIVVAIDPQKINSLNLENVDQKISSQIVLVMDPTVHPSCYSGYPVIVIDRELPLYQKLQPNRENNPPKLGGSVVTLGIDLVSRLQIPRCMILGLDMSYSKDLYYVKGSKFEERCFISNDYFQPMAGKEMDSAFRMGMSRTVDQQGNTVYQDIQFKLMMEWIERRVLAEIQEERRSGCRFYQPDLGIPLKGFEKSKLEKFIAMDRGEKEKKEIELFRGQLLTTVKNWKRENPVNTSEVNDLLSRIVDGRDEEIVLENSISPSLISAYLKNS